MRFAEGDVHGFENTGTVEFVYFSVTSSRRSTSKVYATDWQAGSNNAA